MAVGASAGVHALLLPGWGRVLLRRARHGRGPERRGVLHEPQLRSYLLVGADSRKLRKTFPQSAFSFHKARGNDGLGGALDL